MISETFCVYPWTHISMNTRGMFRPCCNTEDNFGFSISTTSYEEAFKSEQMQILRKQLLLGERPDICKVCWQKESKGLTSYRQLYNNNELLTKAVDIDNPKLVYLDIKFDNKCNLQCIYCEGSSSNQFEKAVKFFKQNDIKLPFNAKDTVIDFHPQLKLQKIKEIVPSIKMLKVTGGEPMLSEHFVELLDYIIEHRYSEHIEIRVTTNLTLVSTELLDKLSKFKHVYVGISIDAVGRLYDYMRYPYTFEKFENRMDTFFQYIKGSSKFTFYFDCLVTSFNILNISDLLFWYMDLPTKYNIPQEMFKHKLDLNVHIAPSTHPLSIYRLPQFVLDEAMSRYFSTRLTSNSDDIFNNLANTMDLGDLKHFTEIYDKQRGLSYRDYVDPMIISLI